MFQQVSQFEGLKLSVSERKWIWPRSGEDVGWELSARVAADTWSWGPVLNTLPNHVENAHNKESSLGRCENKWHPFWKLDVAPFRSSPSGVCVCVGLLDRLRVFWIASSQKDRQHFSCEIISSPPWSTLLKYRNTRLYHSRRVHNHG